MAKTNTLPMPQSVECGLGSILNADATSFKDIVTAGSEGTKVVGLGASSTDTSDREVQIAIDRGGTAYIIGCVTVPAEAGTDQAVDSVDLLAAIASLPVDNDGQKYLVLESGDKLQARSLVTVTSAKAIFLHAVGSHF